MRSLGRLGNGGYLMVPLESPLAKVLQPAGVGIEPTVYSSVDKMYRLRLRVRYGRLTDG